jgi:hypothetical protein
MVTKLALKTNTLHAKQNRTPKLNLTSGLNEHLNELERMGSEVDFRGYFFHLNKKNYLFEISETN